MTTKGNENRGGRMMLRMLLLLTTSGAALLHNNRSARRTGKEKLLEDLRAHDAFKYKSGPCEDNNVVSITFTYYYEVQMVDDEEETVSSVGYLVMTWRDRDLRWNKTDYGGVDMLSIPYNELWHPAIAVSNAVHPENMMVDCVQSMLLLSNGGLMCISQVYLVTACSMDLIYYPFDTQTCNIIFVTAMDDVKYNVSASPLRKSEEGYTVTGEWAITSKHMTSMTIDGPLGANIIRFQACPCLRTSTQCPGGNKIWEHFSMKIQRRPVFYVLCVLTPMILTSLVTSVVFWIPPHSGEKISFLVTVFVSDAVFLNFIAGTMPRNISSLPRLPLFLVLVNVQCVFAMISTVFVMRKYEQEHKNQTNSQPDYATNKDPMFSSGEEAAKITEPTMDSYKNCKYKNPKFKNPRISILKRLSFGKARVSPTINNTCSKSELQHRAQGNSRSCSLRSTTWDMIFFCVYHTISVPCYYLLFKT